MEERKRKREGKIPRDPVPRACWWWRLMHAPSQTAQTLGEIKRLFCWVVKGQNGAEGDPPCPLPPCTSLVSSYPRGQEPLHAFHSLSHFPSQSLSAWSVAHVQMCRRTLKKREKWSTTKLIGLRYPNPHCLRDNYPDSRYHFCTNTEWWTCQMTIIKNVNAVFFFFFLQFSMHWRSLQCQSQK